ncbi:hypothetical protein CPB85DRAFT_1452142 [Mucidula mucida]|nr:hypothetical protein CPB85DRAFT_1452142 [Mucidula mucida]
MTADGKRKRSSSPLTERQVALRLLRDLENRMTSLQDVADDEIDRQSRNNLEFRFELQEEIADSSRAPGATNSMSSDNFNNCLKMLRKSFSDTVSHLILQSTPLWVDFYLLRMIATCSESHPDKTLVIRTLDTTHDEVLDIRVVSLYGSSHAHAYRILPYNDFLRHFCGMLVIRMETINPFGLSLR